MGKLNNISGKDAAKAFQKAGWQTIGQVGSHLVLIKKGMRANLSVPQHKELSVSSGMTVDEFLQLL
jgi:predicted RNA binding protein YcfA (HicA-like mRNA interferase family)